MAVPPQITSASASGEKPRILVVDDNTDAASSLGRLLTLLGNDVRVVYGGEEALTQIEQFKPRIVLLDLGMPGMDGFQTAQHIRRRSSGDSAMLIAVTGWGQEQDRLRSEESGFVEHLTKPVNIEQLEALLSRLLPKK
jgi:CheY-like chemotaxis protein